jgi:hypothetical protein
LFIAPTIGDNEPIPKNIHGNIDIYTENMIPFNCVWIRSPEANEIANDLEIDYAEACIGFKFLRGKAVPKIQGIIVKSKDRSAIEGKIEEYASKEKKRFAHEEEEISRKNWIKIFSIIINKREYSGGVKKDSFFSVLANESENVSEDFDVI